MATVREILGSIERETNGFHSFFNELNFEKDGEKFILSIQDYRQPPAKLPNLLDYESLQVAILKETSPGTYPFINPKDLGFGFSTSPSNEIVPLETIISGIESFLLNGGKILLCTN